MKICPHCHNTYTDDSLQFCLQDGNPLNFQSVTQDWTESETIVSPKNKQSYSTQHLPTQEWQDPVTNKSIESNSPKSNKGKIFILVSLGLLLFLSIVGTGTWILLNNMRNETAKVNSNKVANNTTVPSPTKALNNANSNSSANTNTNTNVAASPTATPTPKPTLKPEESAKIKTQIADTIDGWKSASESHDINGHLNYYGNTIDYYNAGKVSLTKVRADREKAFNMYDSITVDISNVSTTVDESGEKVTTVFDKEWLFENDEKTNSGKVRQELKFAKLGGDWRIISEKDLKVYYVNK